MAADLNPNIVCIDPAAESFAYAVFRDGYLVSVGYATNPRAIPAPKTMRFLWILETPQEYTKFQVAHKDLTRLRETLRKISNFASPHKVITYKPFEWKGNVPKEVHHKRILRALTSKETTLLPHMDGDYEHDLYDAVGIGLFYLQRTSRGGANAQ